MKKDLKSLHGRQEVRIHSLRTSLYVCILPRAILGPILKNVGDRSFGQEENLATDTAFSSAIRTTFVGSMMPASIKST